LRVAILTLARGPADQDEKLGIAANAPTKMKSHPHHMSVVQRGVRSSAIARAIGRTEPASSAAWIQRCRVFSSSTARSRSPRLLHERIEQWIVKRFEGLEGLGWFRRSDQYSDSGPLARNTIAIYTVADV
jgi:hypothetical protein